MPIPPPQRSPLAAWIAASFPHVGQAPPQYDPLFRVVPWAVAQGEFTSDRRHMRAADGAWLQPPPRMSAHVEALFAEPPKKETAT